MGSDIQSSENVSWLALALAPGIGRATLIKLVRALGSASAVWKGDRQVWSAVEGISSRALASLEQGPDTAAAVRCLETVARCGGWLMKFTDEDYPSRLAMIPDPPALLYGMGSRGALSATSVSVVGSRAASSYGKKAAAFIAAGLAARDIGVVSGLALGIDAAAHASCVRAGGSTIAVMGTGIDYVYPARNRELASRIVKKGAVISEYPPGTRPEPGNFPRRNRIISGLSDAVVVIEAGRKSGSLITASLALEQGREVMAVPGSIFSGKSAGTHWLIKQGAALVTDAGDIFSVAGPAHEGREHIAIGAGQEDKPGKCDADNDVPAGLEGQALRLWKELEHYPRHIDELAASCNIPASDAAVMLLQMELAGIVQALPGQRYQRA